MLSIFGVSLVLYFIKILSGSKHFHLNIYIYIDIRLEDKLELLHMNFISLQICFV